MPLSTSLTSQIVFSRQKREFYMFRLRLAGKDTSSLFPTTMPCLYSLINWVVSCKIRCVHCLILFFENIWDMFFLYHQTVFNVVLGIQPESWRIANSTLSLSGFRNLPFCEISWASRTIKPRLVRSSLCRPGWLQTWDNQTSTFWMLAFKSLNSRAEIFYYANPCPRLPR